MPGPLYQSPRLWTPADLLPVGSGQGNWGLPNYYPWPLVWLDPDYQETVGNVSAYLAMLDMGEWGKTAQVANDYWTPDVGAAPAQSGLIGHKRVLDFDSHGSTPLSRGLHTTLNLDNRMTVFVVGQLNGSALLNGVVNMQIFGNRTNPQPTIYSKPVGAVNYWALYNGTEIYTAGGSGGRLSDAAPHIFCASFNYDGTGNSALDIDGEPSIVYGNTGTYQMTAGMSIGTDSPTYDSFWRGWAGCLVIYQGTLNQPARSDIAASLAYEYDIPCRYGTPITVGSRLVFFPAPDAAGGATATATASTATATAQPASAGVSPHAGVA